MSPRPKAPRDWVVRPKPNDGAHRLFCFPSAGNGASAYRDWPALLGEGVDVFCVQPPGRENRLAEAPHKHLDDLLDAMVPMLVPMLDTPFSFFGHSLGSLVAYGAARRLSKFGIAPTTLYVSARRAPHLPLLHPPLHALPDAELVAEIRRYNGTPEAILANRELLELLLPTLRADFQIHETYAHDGGPRLDAPIFAFGGTRDPGVPADSLDAWRDHTSGTFLARAFEGGHFYLNEHKAELVGLIRAAIARFSG